MAPAGIGGAPILGGDVGVDPFRNLDDESRALHADLGTILGLGVQVTVVALVVWAACAALATLVHRLSGEILALGDMGWSVPFLLAALGAGGWLQGWLVTRPGWEGTAGDGVGQAIEAYHSTYEVEGDDPAPRFALPTLDRAWRKAVATVVTLGSGHSGGLEGPIVAISEALAAGLGKARGLDSEYHLRTWQVAGVAAGVTTLLGAPFTGALFAIEVFYGDRIVYRHLAWASWAAVLAYACTNRLHGAFEPLFVGPAHQPTWSVPEYATAAVVAVAVSVPVVTLFKRTLALAGHLTDRVRPELQGVVTSVASGLLAVGVAWITGGAVEDVLGAGEHTIETLLSHPDHLGAGALLLILLARALAVGLTLRGGGSAGLLVPSMVLGGVGGALVSRWLVALTGAALDPALFTVVGIGSALVAVVGVPLSAMALVIEIFGPSFGPPAVLACALTWVVTLRMRLYQR